MRRRKKPKSSLIKSRNRKKHNRKISDRHNTDEPIEFPTSSTDSLLSVLVQKQVTRFMDSLEINPREKLVHEPPSLKNFTRESKIDITQKEVFPFSDYELDFPHRPSWNKKMPKKEYLELEKKSFLDWRRKLAKIEERYIVTPFEKNVNVWKQLWRVLEKSSVLFQIVDARNPLLFRSKKLEQYVEQIGKNEKKMVLLINKSDLLSKKQRKMWKRYFEQEKIEVLFFSAYKENEKIESVVNSKENKEFFKKYVEACDNYDIEKEEDSCKLLSRAELIGYFKNLLKKTEKMELSIGMIGYPNVGKSSVINVISGIKRVAVASTPGKTKYIQTIPIGESITLLDCPGLVFPQISSTKYEMLLNGILPINHIRTDFMPCIRLICKRIPRTVLELTYGFEIISENENENEKEIDDDEVFAKAEDFLNVFCLKRNIMKKGNINVKLAAKKILEDYTNGKLVFCHPPPVDFDEEWEEKGEESEEEEESDEESEEDESESEEGEQEKNENEEKENIDVSGPLKEEVIVLEDNFIDKEGAPEEFSSEESVMKYLKFNESNVSVKRMINRFNDKLDGRKKKKKKRRDDDRKRELEKYVTLENGVRIKQSEFKNYLNNKKFEEKKQKLAGLKKQQIKQLKKMGLI